MVSGIKVDRLLRGDTHFYGIAAGGEEMTAKVIIAADGVNSFLAQEAGVRPKQPAKHLGLGVKSVIKIGEEAVRERFNLTGGEGAAYALVGDATMGVPGGGFMYTNWGFGLDRCGSHAGKTHRVRPVPPPTSTTISCVIPLRRPS